MMRILCVIALGLIGCAHPAGEAGRSAKVGVAEAEQAYCYPCTVDTFDRCVPWAFAQFKVPCFPPGQGLEVEGEIVATIYDEGIGVIWPGWIRDVNRHLAELGNRHITLEPASRDEFRAHPAWPAKHLQLVSPDGRRLLFHLGPSVGFAPDRVVDQRVAKQEAGEGGGT